MIELLTEEERRFEMSVDFGPSVASVLMDMVGTEKNLSLTYPRSWRKRVFSWPWRPWMNGIAYEGLALITGWRANEPNGATVTLSGKGALMNRLVRTSGDRLPSRTIGVVG